MGESMEKSRKNVAKNMAKNRKGAFSGRMKTLPEHKKKREDLSL
jgi:hypothetical protein